VIQITIKNFIDSMYPETSQTPRLMILTDGYPPDGKGGATRIPYYQAKGF
ncbi:uncharacterized protein METZ01_LOCUS264851, partial [marine metagenome]